MRIYYLLVFLLHLFSYGHGDSDIHIGYQVTLAVPMGYTSGFIGRAFVMETEGKEARKFRAAVSVEAVNEKYSCSIDVFLASVKVWSSGHLSTFYTTDKCMLHLTQYGDLLLKGQEERVGWRTGTSGQGVERLHLLRSGNLVLVDALNLIKWQTFNFPTDVMLWGQRLSSRTRLTSFISSNSSIFYSFEIQYDKIALYLNSDKLKYTYWEFKPSDEQNITYVQLTSRALEIFTGISRKIGEIKSQNLQPLKFLALSNSTGNLGLYFYSTDKQGFQASYQALNSTCDFPMACKPYGICTFSKECSCIRLITRGSTGSLSNCNEGQSEVRFEGICGKRQAEMVELEGVTSVLRGIIPSKVNVSHEECGNLCLNDCTCVAALYSSNETAIDYQNCFLYGLVRGVKQVERGRKFIYMVKVPKGPHGKRLGLKRWIAILIGVGDGFIILVVLGGIGYYFIQNRRRNSLDTRHPH